MQQSRQDSFLDGEDDPAVPMGDSEEADGHDEAGNIDLDDGNDDDDDDDLFLEEVSDEFAPLLSDAERFWGASAAPEKVVASIEEFWSAFAEAHLQGQRPDLVLQPLPPSILSRAQEHQAAPAPENVAPRPPLPPPPSTVLSLSDSVSSSALALRISRLLLVLDIVHEALSDGRTVTVRRVWYLLKSACAATNKYHIERAIDDAQMLLALPREALGLRAAPKSAVAGCLWIANDDDGGGEEAGGSSGGGRNATGAKTATTTTTTTTWNDLRCVDPAGFSLPGCPAAARALRVASDAAFLIVVEKDAVFERLVEDRVWEGIPGGAVLVTGRGMPDLATRAFCSHLLRSSSQSSSPASLSSSASASNTPPPMQVLGLCDWNPGGVRILTVYKHGSFAAAAAANAAAHARARYPARASLEGVAYALPSLHWLGARSSWFLRAKTRDEAFQPLTDRDRDTARSLAGVFSDIGLILARGSASSRS